MTKTQTNSEDEPVRSSSQEPAQQELRAQQEFAQQELRAQQEPAQQELRQQLKNLLQAIEASGRAVLPRLDNDLLQSIVEAAARIFGAAAASIALVDEACQQLEFKVAFGMGSEGLVGLRIPIDQGLAGYVATTGQPMTVQNVENNSRFNKDFAKTTGYVPRSILAVPLFSSGKIIGVMEVLDKISSPSFGMRDMELLRLFARQAAMAIHQSQQYDRLEAALRDGLRTLAGEDSAALREALEPGCEPATNLLQQVADHFYELSALGETEQRACLDILRAFQAYARAKKGMF